MKFERKAFCHPNKFQGDIMKKIVFFLMLSLLFSSSTVYSAPISDLQAGKTYTFTGEVYDAGFGFISMNDYRYDKPIRLFPANQAPNIPEEFLKCIDFSTTILKDRYGYFSITGKIDQIYQQNVTIFAYDSLRCEAVSAEDECRSRPSVEGLQATGVVQEITSTINPNPQVTMKLADGKEIYFDDGNFLFSEDAVGKQFTVEYSIFSDWDWRVEECGSVNAPISISQIE
jgi:type 1 fimbria pilin